MLRTVEEVRKEAESIHGPGFDLLDFFNGHYDRRDYHAVWADGTKIKFIAIYDGEGVFQGWDSV